MEITGLILLVVLVVVLVYFVMIYNQLVQIKHNVSKSWLLKFSSAETQDVDVKQLFQA